MRVDDRDVDLTGLIDMHIHTAPDVRPRALDDLEAAEQASEAGMRAIVLKSHVASTAGRAATASGMAAPAKVLGGVTLNDAVGGLNPAAVEACLAMGGRVVWLPTVSAMNHVTKQGGRPPGISLLDRDGRVSPALYDIFELVKERDAVLATGHASAQEIMAIVPAARKHGVKKIVVTHPEVPWVGLSTALQIQLRDLGAGFERCFASLQVPQEAMSFSCLVADLREVGVASTVIATDLGRADLPLPVAGLRAYIARLMSAGFSREEIRVMAAEKPAELLGL